MPEAKKTKLKKRKAKLKVKKKPMAKPANSMEDVGAGDVAIREKKVYEEELIEKSVEEKKDEVPKKKRKKMVKAREEKIAGKKTTKDMVALNYKALNKVLRHGMRFSAPNMPSKDWIECMGFLIGDVNDGRVEIKDAIPIVHGSLVEVEFKDEHYSKADEINQNLTDENWVVGWYHTHPGHGLFLSAVDKINQSGYQSLNPKAVALVFDPSKFGVGSRLEKYIKIFRLKDPGLREGSDFVEVENVEIQHSLQEVIGSFYEASQLSSKDYPLVLEYGEDYKKPEVVSVSSISEEAEGVEKNIKEMQKLIKYMNRDVKILRSQLESHMASTKKAIEDLKKGEKGSRIKKPKPVGTCEFCGYESIMPGDAICASCGWKL